jgi:hypothetical protein
MRKAELVRVNEMGRDGLYTKKDKMFKRTENGKNNQRGVSAERVHH